MQERTATTTTFAKKPNKGFTIHLGDTYIGYLVIGEKNVPDATVAEMQKPENMAAILAQSELKVFTDAKTADMSAVEAILAQAKEQAAAQSAKTDGELKELLSN